MHSPFLTFPARLEKAAVRNAARYVKNYYFIVKSEIILMIATQIIRCRVTATLRRPQMKQYTALNEGGHKTNENIKYFWQSMKRYTRRPFRKMIPHQGC